MRKRGHGIKRYLRDGEFPITPKMADWFNKQGFRFDIHEATARWADSMQAGGYQYIDWGAAWRNGMRQVQKWEADRNIRAQAHAAVKPQFTEPKSSETVASDGLRRLREALH